MSSLETARRSWEEGGVGDPLAAVFISTSLNTHLALDVRRSDTVADLKKQLLLAHLSSYPSYGEINIGAVKVMRRGCFFSLYDSMLVCSIVYGMKYKSLLHVDASTRLEHLEVGDIRDCAKVSIVDEVNEAGRVGFVKGASSLGPGETGDKETRIDEGPKNVLTAPEKALDAKAGHASGFQQNDPEQGEINGEFMRDKSIQVAVGDDVRDPEIAGVVGNKSSTKKRKKSDPKSKSSRKRQAKGTESALPLIPLEEAIDGDKIEVNSQGSLSQKEVTVAVQEIKRKKYKRHSSTKNAEQVGDASASSLTTKKKSRKCIITSAVSNPDDREGERIEVVAGTNKSNASTRMELTKEMDKRGRSTADPCSAAAAENSSKLNSQASFEPQDRSLSAKPARRMKKHRKPRDVRTG